MKLSVVLFILGAVSVSRDGAAAAGNGNSSTSWPEGSTADSVDNRRRHALAFLQAFMKSNWVEDAKEDIKNMEAKVGEIARDVSNNASEAVLEVSQPLEEMIKSAVKKGISTVDNANVRKELSKLWEKANSGVHGQTERVMAVDYERVAYDFGQGIRKIVMELKDAGGRISNVGSKVEGVAEEALAKRLVDIKKFTGTLENGLKAYTNLLGEEASWIMREIERHAARIIEETEKTTKETKRRVSDGMSALRGAADEFNRAVVSGYQGSEGEDGSN